MPLDTIPLYTEFTMSELTKEHFDKQLGLLVKKSDLEQILDDRFEEQARLINTAFQAQKDHFDKEIARLESKIDALSAKLTTHLELSDKRYLELKRRDVVIAKWIQKIADKTGVQIDLKELEKF